MTRPRASSVRLALLIGVPLLVVGLVAAVVALRPSGPVVLPTPAAPEPGRLRTAQEWLVLFDRQWHSEQREAERLSHSPDSWDHYTLSYSVDALTAAYLASGNRDYLGQAVDLVANVVDSARESRSLEGSQYHDSYLGWASSRDRGNEIPLYESYFWRYATTVLAVIRDTSEVYADPSFRVPYERLLAFAERNVMEKWYGPDETIYRSRTHMAAHWALIALNLSRITTDPQRRAVEEEGAGRRSPGSPNYRRRCGAAQTNRPNPTLWSDKVRLRAGTCTATAVAARDAGGSGAARTCAASSRCRGRDQPRRDPAPSTPAPRWFSDGFKLPLRPHRPAPAGVPRAGERPFYANGRERALLACGSADGDRAAVVPSWSSAADRVTARLPAAAVKARRSPGQRLPAPA
jgi:hypothetical protein